MSSTLRKFSLFSINQTVGDKNGNKSMKKMEDTIRKIEEELVRQVEVNKKLELRVQALENGKTYTPVKKELRHEWLKDRTDKNDIDECYNCGSDMLKNNVQMGSVVVYPIQKRICGNCRKELKRLKKLDYAHASDKYFILEDAKKLFPYRYY